MTLRVIVQVVPFGDEDKTYEIDRLDISNFGNSKNTPGVFDYMFKFKDQEYNKRVIEHTRKDGAWVLIKKVLNFAV